MILHLVTKSLWEQQANNKLFITESLAKEGFIHCTGDSNGLLQVANRFYKHVIEACVALEIDPAKLTAPLKWEAPAHPAQQTNPADTLPTSVTNEMGASNIALTQFPHVYGPINREAIVRVIAIKRDQEGNFIGYETLENQTQTAITPSHTQSLASKEPKPALAVPGEKTNDPRTPIMKAADELVSATGDFSDELQRLKDRIEGKITKLDEEINKL